MRTFERFRPTLLLPLLGLLVLVAGCDNSQVTAPTPTGPDQSAVAYSQTDLTPGTGTEATAGRTVTVQYGGWLYSETATDHKGTQFDASTFSFLLGGGSIIKGFDTGVSGM